MGSGKIGYGMKITESLPADSQTALVLNSLEPACRGNAYT
jgi:hypothetical protein